jgi:hypothetical protein
MDGMAILNLLDTEYLDEFDYGNLTIKPQYESTYIEEPEAKKEKPNNGYTYRSMLEVFFPE